MNIALKTALYRLLRGVAYAAIAYGLQWMTQNFGLFHIPTAFIPFVTALLLAIDKWAREVVKPNDPALPGE